MSTYYSDDFVTILHGDCREILPGAYPVEACITDPPYELGFMGKGWDRSGVAFDSLTWGCVAASLLPGAPLLAFGGTRTFHRLTCAIEDAGFEIRDCLMWLYGSGFPKSLDISKAIDKAAGAEREVVGTKALPGGWHHEHTINDDGWQGGPQAITAPATDAAKLWHGWGTALKPAWEPIVLAMKPLDGTFAQNALKHGVAGLNVDGARIAGDEDGSRNRPASSLGSAHSYAQDEWTRTAVVQRQDTTGKGRWPANLVLDEDAAAMLDEQAPDAGGGFVKPYKRASHDYYSGAWPDSHGGGHDFGGGASRFFYTSKASRADRGPDNDHPTVKPSDLMKWLVTLTATPTGGTILDPFMGSGTTLYAAKEMGRRAIGIDINEAYCEIAARRCEQGVLAL